VCFLFFFCGVVGGVGVWVGWKELWFFSHQKVVALAPNNSPWGSVQFSRRPPFYQENSFLIDRRRDLQEGQALPSFPR